MASLHMSLRIRAALLLLCVGCSWVQCSPCPEEEPDCETAIGTAVHEVAPPPPREGRRMLRTTPRFPSAVKQNPAPHLADRRSLLAPMCPETDNSIDAVIACTNAVRASPNSFSGDMRCSLSGVNGGLGPLDKHPALVAAAQKHSEDNARMGDLTHTGSDGSRSSDRVSREGYDYNSVRENIAWGYSSARSVVMGWMCSDGHRRNIMACDISDIGVGIATGRDGRYYHTQVFACPRGESCGCSGGDGSVPQGGSEPTQDTTGASQETTTGGETTNTGAGTDPYYSDNSYNNDGYSDGSSDYSDGSSDYNGGSSDYGGSDNGSGGYDPYYGYSSQEDQSDSNDGYYPYSNYGGYDDQDSSGGFYDFSGDTVYQSEDGTVTVRRGGSDGSSYTYVSANQGGSSGNLLFGK